MKRNFFSTLPKRSRGGSSQAGAWLAAAAAVALLAATLTGLVATATAFDAPPGTSGSGGGDPTVGTLPMGGGQGYDGLDQTLTLRGPSDVLRVALEASTGSAGSFYEVVPLPDDQAWVRLYGDVLVELDLSILDEVEVGVFAGFDGNGMRYALGQREGFGTARELSIGGELMLDTVRMVNTELLETPLYLMALHNSGERTKTVIRYLPTSGTIVLEQDI